ncbi:hypothetical protein, partial [Bacteroides uniformis]|uniref:hypothetical protein n=1 Tax=Bacteroides uniformis TaxID=820 RepID=UPI001956C481
HRAARLNVAVWLQRYLIASFLRLSSLHQNCTQKYDLLGDYKNFSEKMCCRGIEITEMAHEILVLRD